MKQRGRHSLVLDIQPIIDAIDERALSKNSVDYPDGLILAIDNQRRMELLGNNQNPIVIFKPPSKTTMEKILKASNIDFSETSGSN